MRRGSIDLSVTSSASLIGKPAPISQAREHQSMPDPLSLLLVGRQPGDRADRTGDEYKAIGVAARSVAQQLRQGHRDRHTGEIVVAERRVADMRRHEHFSGVPAGKTILTVGQVAGCEGRVDTDVVLVVCQRLTLTIRETKTPGLVI